MDCGRLGRALTVSSLQCFSRPLRTPLGPPASSSLLIKQQQSQVANRTVQADLPTDDGLMPRRWLRLSHGDPRFLALMGTSYESRVKLAPDTERRRASTGEIGKSGAESHDKHVGDGEV
ncbi:hypothetical protein BBK36DRAFT_1175218 [Trichoderma citrinoviride]|uniref:Uncharacterized protein n=1 Tax=Trichoderma citrinoviride TaxID=58853 RepID=A0A2T4BN03_9HYPO|nr:hypothetical protein BBK36DRAFT_1175218 [Trichoderma citrinoviride]PTB70698.1 hypothetical protein BBK36DRAFT_1175218 [Trichoderma citrinoviride]